MSRELLGFAPIAVVCIILTPFYQGQDNEYRKLETRIIVKEQVPESKMAQSDSPKSIILLSDQLGDSSARGHSQRYI